MQAGDTVINDHDEELWQGASATVTMAHIAIQQGHDGSLVTWMEHATEDTYLT